VKYAFGSAYIVEYLVGEWALSVELGRIWKATEFVCFNEAFEHRIYVQGVRKITRRLRISDRIENRNGPFCIA
jgi:hypothetical protein